MSIKKILAAGVIALISATPSFAASANTDVVKYAAPIDQFTANQRSSNFDGCKDLFPKSRPIRIGSIAPEWRPRGLCSDTFAVLHSGLSKTPLVVVEKLSRLSLKSAKGIKRTDNFFADPRIPHSDRAHPSDYIKTGYDKGHMSPAADQPSYRAMRQSFAMSNMVPQDADNNRITWNKLEADTRKYVERASGDVFVYSGPLFDPGFKRVGKGQVYVPTRLFKLVYDESNGKAWAHVLMNNSTDKLKAPMSYESFVKLTGLDYLAGVYSTSKR